MTAYPLTAATTLTIVLLLFWTAARVGVARKRHGISAPAVTGHPQFERAYRVQLNTLEWAVMVMPCLWVCAGFVADWVGALLGAIWVVARVWYMFAYQRDPARRGPAFLCAALAFAAAGVLAAGGVARALLWGIP